MGRRRQLRSRCPAQDREAIEREIADLEQFRDLATSIDHNAKGDALLKALHVAFAQGRGAGRRAEGDRLHRVAEDTGLSAAPAGRQPVEGRHRALQRLEHRRAVAADLRRMAASGTKGTDRVTGSRTADMRSALVDYFREQGQIMIATEAGAEGINLQFCSLVVNYDLPWNPQRIEQRIGRCHRYGQKHDVVVVNFLNRKNEADQRVFELLVREVPALRGRVRRQRRGARRHRVRRRLREADRRHLPAVPHAGGDQRPRSTSCSWSSASRSTRR